MANAQKTVGRRVVEFRHARRATQEKIAEHAGVDVSYIARLEAGRLNPTLAKLEAIAAALGVPVMELLRGEPDRPSGVPRPLVDALRRLAPEDIACVLYVARRFGANPRKRAG